MSEDAPTGRATRVWVAAIRVSSFDRALTFYRDVLGFPVQLEARKFNWIEVGPEEPLCKIGMAEDPERAADGTVTRTGIVLEVAEMDSFAARLRAQDVRITDEPEKQPWGGVMMNFLDPDGNQLQAVYDPGHYDTSSPQA